MRLSRLFFILTVLLMLFAAAAGIAEEEDLPAYPPLPQLSDPLDQHMQSLAAIYQKDPRFSKLTYNQGLFSVRGCAPSAIANAVIAAFDVTDVDVAEQVVRETLRILCPGSSYGRAPIEQTKLKILLNPQQMAESAEKYPGMSTVVGGYPGTVDFSLDPFTLEQVQSAIAGYTGDPRMTMGRINVRESWERAVRILYALHDASLDDAVLILAYAGAGTASGKAPLRTSSNGHYLTLYIPVGAFVENGTIFVLDSMPRALFGEEYRPGLAYRRCYAFVEEAPDKGFNANFTASRISPTIIRIDLNTEAAAQLGAVREAKFASPLEKSEALIAEHTRLLEPFIVYSTCTAILRFPEQ